MISVLLRNGGDAVPYKEMLRIRRTWCFTLVLLPGRRDAGPYKALLSYEPLRKNNEASPFPAICGCMITN